jgi:Tfp pilus assembly protein PilO
MPTDSKSPSASIRRGSWLVTLALGAAALVYLFCVFLPTSRKIRQMREEIRSQEDFIAHATYLPAALADAQKQLDAAQRYATQWHGHLAAPDRLADLSGRLTKQADLAGTSTTRFEPQQPHDCDYLRTVPIKLDARGGFTQAADLLARLEQLPELIWVDELRITPAGETAKNVQIDLNLTVFAGNSEKSE